MSLKRVAVDLDQTLCELKTKDQTYLDVKPLPGAVEAMQKLKAEGFYIVIHTARGMATFNGNINLINVHRVPEIKKWLDMWEIPHDEISVGKPHVGWFVDDKSVEFKNNWEEIAERILKESNK